MGTTNADASIQTKILFVTNSESGQANTILAMALEATTRPHVEVHVASFPVLKQRVERLSPRINFHPLVGRSMAEAVLARGFTVEELPHPPMAKSREPYGQVIPVLLTVWDGECEFCFLLWMWVVTYVCHLFLFSLRAIMR